MHVEEMRLSRCVDHIPQTKSLWVLDTGIQLIRKAEIFLQYECLSWLGASYAQVLLWS